MRVTRAQAAENRARILAEAARLFRERGLGGVGVDALGEAAGMTHGSLYSQFGSKEGLAAAAVAHAMAQGLLAQPAEPGAWPEVVRRYLSAAHRDRPGAGCAMAALGCEVARGTPAVRRSFTEGLRARVANVATMLPEAEGIAPEEAAMAAIAGLVGAMVLARAVDDPDFSNRILEATAKRLTEG